MRSFQQEQSVVTIVTTLLSEAIKQAASDIHLEQTQDALRVRFRLDGVLHDQKPISISVMPQIISHLKVLGNINIAQKRIAQDGKFNITHNNVSIDLRVSTFPALYGEKIVIRILDRAAHAMALDKLGFANEMHAQFLQLIKKSSGFFLVTGPTGSGKTTTLYSALAALNCPEKNIVTLEDPVEYNLEGITQGYINPQAGFTFETGVRHVLRQDPDVLMVGEIRDKQTARVAIEAAMTGHVVLSTLHTNDAPSAIMRLMDMGIEPFLINASLTGVLAQRLVRSICSGCKVEYAPTQQELDICKIFNEDISVLHKGTGCAACNNLGYKGRTGVFELLPISSELRALMVNQPNLDAMYQQTAADGIRRLACDGFQKVKNGVITLEELMRVLA